MPDFKPISREAIPLCLDKADRYRLLNEPTQAESICLDVLAIDADNQRALIILLLTLTDQFTAGPVSLFTQAEAIVPRLHGEYERLYYAGIIWERRATARLTQGGLGSATAAHAWVSRAMQFYEQAEKIRPAENDDAILRWNSCLRLCLRHHLRPEEEEVHPSPVGDD